MSMTIFYLRLIQQATLEQKQFEEQQRQLSAMHLHQQSELQKKQQLLRQMQEAQFINLQKQQQMLLIQQTIQQQLQQQQQQQQQQQRVRKGEGLEGSGERAVRGDLFALCSGKYNGGFWSCLLSDCIDA